MTDIQATAIIRDRGQLTIPGKIRASLAWSTPHSVVCITKRSKKELIITPFEGRNDPDWAAIWTNIRLCRSYTGKRGNLSSYITSDRQSH